jgi:endonuclease/exonuclease/phosphatase family metal-dependent hydrolase
MFKLIFTIFLFNLIGISYGQNQEASLFKGFDDNPRGRNAARIMFYNVENLFDTEHDSLKFDQQFLPEGDHRWDKRKYWAKQKKIAQVITAVGGWEMPTVVGLAEIENIHTLLNLVHHTQLKSTNYHIIHHESPDRRGIDVALLYREEKFQLLFDSAISIRFPFDTASRTRDILYVKALLFDSDTVHFVVTHWPSKYGGAFVTIPKRVYVAQQIRKLTDAIMQENPNANIIIMGDLNDTPDEKSLMEGLQAVAPDSNSTEPLFNLMLPLIAAGQGTHFYKGPTGAEWSFIDQFIVSRGLYNARHGVRIKNNKPMVFRAPFLLEKNNAGLEIPNRSYIGMKYHGGYSDHLPVYLDLERP